jgi:Flp pilus assembly protein TadD
MGLVFAILIVYWQVTHHEFVSFDDGLYVTDNPIVQAGITFDGIQWAFGFNDIAYWHPLTWLSHMLDCHLFGLDAGKHHLTNVIFHIANSLLLFFAGMRLTGRVGPSALVAALFAIHPINAESVAWVAERKNVLSTFFGMLALLSYSFYTNKPAWGKYTLTLLTFALGLMVKPALVTLPFIFLLLDFWPLRRLHPEPLIGSGSFGFKIPDRTRLKQSNLWPVIVEKIPFFALSGVSLVLTIVSAQHHGIVVSAQQIPIYFRIANALVSYMTYIGKLLWPSHLAVFYPYPQTIPVWLWLGAGIWLVCISMITIRFRKQMPFLIVGWLWYLGTLIPHLGFVQAGIWPAMADRWAYVPFIGLFIMIAWGGFALWSRFPKSKVGLAVSGGILISAFVIVSWIQVGYWMNSIRLYQHAAAVTENNDVAHNNLGAAYFNAGRVDKAIFHFVEALRIMPGFSAAHANLNKALSARAMNTDVAAKMKKLIELYPAVAALKFNLGNLYRNRNDFDTAMVYYRQALSDQPNFIQAINNLAAVYVIQEDYPRALHLLKKILEIERDASDVSYTIACIYAKQANVEEATDWLKKAVRMGFNQWDLLKSDPRLENIRDSLYYKNLTQKH